MAVQESVTWTCDRCGSTETYVDEPRGKQPDDWGTLGEIVPPNAAHSELDKLGLICRPCRSDLREWMAEGQQ